MKDRKERVDFLSLILFCICHKNIHLVCDINCQVASNLCSYFSLQTSDLPWEGEEKSPPEFHKILETISEPTSQELMA